MIETELLTVLGGIVVGQLLVELVVGDNVGTTVREVNTVDLAGQHIGTERKLQGVFKVGRNALLRILRLAVAPQYLLAFLVAFPLFEGWVLVRSPDGGIGSEQVLFFYLAVALSKVVIPGQC